MEFLVRKASLSLFLQDQVERNETRVLKLISEDKELIRSLEEIMANREKLAALDEEIKVSEQVELLEEIIKRAKGNENSSITFMGIGTIPIPITPFIERLIQVFRLK